MSCCGPRKKEYEPYVKNYEWVFSNGTCVAARSLQEAVEKFNEVSPKRFWASEILPGRWDVQLTESIVHYNISAESVMEAVNKARWYTHLDKSLKTLEPSNSRHEF